MYYVDVLVPNKRQLTNTWGTTIIPSWPALSQSAYQYKSPPNTTLVLHTLHFETESHSIKKYWVSKRTPLWKLKIIIILIKEIEKKNGKESNGWAAPVLIHLCFPFFCEDWVWLQSGIWLATSLSQQIEIGYLSNEGCGEIGYWRCQCRPHFQLCVELRCSEVASCVCLLCSAIRFHFTLF